MTDKVPPYRLITMGNYQLAVLGIRSIELNPAPPEIFQEMEPITAIKAVLGEVKKITPFILVLCDGLTSKEGEALLDIKDIDYVFGLKHLPPENKEKTAEPSFPRSYGALVSILSLERRQVSNSFSVRFILDHKVEEAEEIKNLFNAKKVYSPFTLAGSLNKTKVFTYVQIKVCISCHREQGENWQNTPHAKSWATLISSSSEKDKFCLGCHSTGFYYQSGYIATEYGNENLANVGCEACHGPGGNHVERIKATMKLMSFASLSDKDNEEIKTSDFPQSPSESCGDCHNSITSPGFDYKTWWKDLAHHKEGGKNK